jgi:hypothetical protein
MTKQVIEYDPPTPLLRGKYYFISKTIFNCTCSSCSHGLIVVEGLDSAAVSIVIVLYIGYELLLIMFSLIEIGLPIFISDSSASDSALDCAFSKASFLAISRVADSSSFV